ncbi:MAG: aldehyde dehydrogenase family protein [Anaerolineae bacterium]|nr:aldehyde dehydrogenase family protein [Anaerolineae bacterium]
MTVSEQSPIRTAPETITIRNPVTSAVIGEVPIQSADEVRRAVERARAAFPAWAARSVQERATLLRKWGDLIMAEQDKMIATIRSETGKIQLHAWEEVLVIDNTVDYYYYRAAGILRPQTRRSLIPMKFKARMYYKPYGVCGFITPWNYPLLNALQDLIPALIAGNTVILKPSEITPFTALYAVELMHRVGIPKDVAQVVTGAGQTGSALVDLVDDLSFTGSTATGRKIAMRCAERLIPYSLELGGKDALIVLKDANIDLAATGTLAGSLENSGQVCVATERVYVEAAVYDQYIERIRHYVAQMVQGSGDGMWDIHIGSMTNEREVQRAEQQLADAVSKGAKVLYGGKRRPDLGPLFFEPTLLVDVDHSMEVMREETFGPLIPIMKVKDEAEAIRLANDNRYGLSGAIYTRDLKRGEQLATQMESGDVHVNCTSWIFGIPTLPMGGVKESGVGRRNGPEGLLRFVKPQSIVIDNELMNKPKLTLVDEFGLRIALLIRSARRYIPFLRL